MNVAMPVGMVGVSDQALPRQDLFKTEFYNDWLRPQENIVAGPAMICYRSKERLVAMAGPCRARGIDNTLPGTVALFEALAPHLARSINISSALCVGGSPAFSYLDASPHGIIIIRRSGCVGYTNKAAERFIAKTGVLTTDRRERLGSKDEEVLAYLNSATAAMQADSYCAMPNSLLVRTKKFGECMFHAHIFPNEVEHKFPCSAWADPVAGAVVVSGQLGIGGVDYDGRIARSFGATLAEASLAEGLLGGLSLYEYADLHRLSRHTVRNQMRSLLLKTDTANQVEFTRKMLRLASPFLAV